MFIVNPEIQNSISLLRIDPNSIDTHDVSKLNARLCQRRFVSSSQDFIHVTYGF